MFYNGPESARNHQLTTQPQNDALDAYSREVGCVDRTDADLCDNHGGAKNCGSDDAIKSSSSSSSSEPGVIGPAYVGAIASTAIKARPSRMAFY